MTEQKDFLHGLNYKTAIGLGVVLYFMSRFGFGGAVFELAGIALFAVGLYRWNKVIRESKKLAKSNQEK